MILIVYFKVNLKKCNFNLIIITYIKNSRLDTVLCVVKNNQKEREIALPMFTCDHVTYIVGIEKQSYTVKTVQGKTCND